MDNLNNLELLSEMEKLGKTHELERKNDEFPFVLDMSFFWKSLVNSFEQVLDCELKANSKLNGHRPISVSGV